jgi:Cft2 family RNA processing exonuclease
MLEWIDALKLSRCDLYFDSRKTQPRCVVSHAHSDHLAIHDRAFATAPTAVIASKRIGAGNFTQLNYREDFSLDSQTRLRLLPAGHVLGSAMAHVTRPEGTLLYTGDFKLRNSLTAESAMVETADFLVMESTYGQPHFRFPPWQKVAEELVDRVTAAIHDGRQPIVMGYSLGKAQEITRILTDAGLPVTLHGAVWSIHQIYEQFGVRLGNVRRYAVADFHGERALDLWERGVLVAPPSVARSGFVTRFANPLRIVMTGWAVLKNAPYRYGVDHALPLSDHADFDELLELVERVHPRKIFTHHGYKEFADILRSRGHDASLAQPERQLRLFDEVQEPFLPTMDR